MSAVSLKKKWFKSLLLLGLTPLLLSGCLFHLGLDKVPLISDDLALTPCQETLSESKEPIKVEVKFLGPAQPIATQRNIWGRVTHMVIPYTRSTYLFELKLDNQTDQPVLLETAKIKLVASFGQAQEPLELDFFNAQWPTSAIVEESHVLDQSQAIGHVIRTIYMPHPLGPYKERTGILAFRRFRFVSQDKLYLKLEGIRWGDKTLERQFCWQTKAPSTASTAQN